MKNSRIPMGAMVLALAAVAIIACSKEKTAQQETPAVQQTADPNDLTLAEMADAMSWEDGKAFFENQTVRDYSYVCESVMNDCNDDAKTQGLPYSVSWVWKMPNGMCNSSNPGLCLAIRKKDGSSMQANALGYFEDGTPVLGLPGCVMYAKATVFDLILPRIAAGVRIARKDIVGMGHGGLCLGCKICHYPDCSFGKGV